MPDSDDHLTTTLWQRASAYHPNEVFRFWHDGAWRGLTWTQVADEVRRIAGGLIGLGVGRGDRVALLSRTRMEWSLADLAILSAGAVTVPIEHSWSPDRCTTVLADSNASLAIVETAGQAEQREHARAHTPRLEGIFVLDDAGLEAIAEHGDDTTRARVGTRVAESAGADLATIVYGAPSAAQPDGRPLSHGVLTSAARRCAATLRPLLGRSDATLLVLPLAGSFGRVVQFFCLEANLTVGFPRSADTMVEDLQSFGPTLLLSGPDLPEQLFATVESEAEGRRRIVFEFAVASAGQWSSRAEPGPLDAIRRAVADRLVYHRLREVLGGQVRHWVTAGAPLDPAVTAFFHAAGIPIIFGGLDDDGLLTMRASVA